MTRVIREWKVLVFVGLKVMEEVSKFVDLEVNGDLKGMKNVE